MLFEWHPRSSLCHRWEGTLPQEIHTPEARTSGRKKGRAGPSQSQTPDRGSSEGETPEMRSPGVRQRQDTPQKTTPGDRHIPEPRRERAHCSHRRRPRPSRSPSPSPSGNAGCKSHSAHLCLYRPPLDATHARHQHLMSGGSGGQLRPRIWGRLPAVPDVVGLPTGLGR